MMEESQKMDFSRVDIFAPMSEQEVENFEIEMLPRNSSKRADEVSLKEAVEFVSHDFGRLFQVMES